MPGIVSLPPFPVGLTGGRSDRTITGTGRARPGGVEHIWEYNGALLNVRDWYDTFVITSIDGLGDPDVRDSREVNPGRDGETYFQAYYGGRTIVLSGYIRAFSLAKLRDMQMGLKQVFADLSGEKPLYVRTGDPSKDVFIYCKKSQSIVMGEAQGNFEYRRDFQVTLRASNPRFLSYLEERIALGGATSTIPLPPVGHVAAVNMLKNPSPQSGWTIGWATQGGGTFEILPDYPMFTDHGQTPSGSGNYFLGMTSTVDQGLTVLPGQTYRWKGEYDAEQIASGATQMNFLIRFFRPGGTWIDARNSIPFTTQTRGFFNVTGTAPSDVTGVQLIAYTYSTVGDAVWKYQFTNMTFTLSTYDGDYFDGENGLAYWIDSTPYLSQSVLMSDTGLEGYYTDSNGYGQFVDVDRWVKDFGLRRYGWVSRVMIRSDQSRKYTDVQATVKYRTGPSLTGEFGHVLKLLSNSEYLNLQIVLNNANTRLKIDKNESGPGTTTLNQSAVFTPAANTTYWLVARQTGNALTVENWTTDPALGGGAPSQSVTYTLGGADAAKFGASIAGNFGIRVKQDNHAFAWTNQQIQILVTESIVTFSADNEGNAPAQPQIIVNGPLSSSTSGGHALRVGINRTLQDGSTISSNLILNAKSGSTLAIPSGNYIVIDTDKRTLKEYNAAGVLVRNSYDQLDISSDWVELPPGPNTVEVESYIGGSTPSVEFRYRHTFF